jgi:magnesium chelatase family protein
VLQANAQLMGWMNFIMGELSLDGRLMPVSGVLSMALFAQENNLNGCILPGANA